MAQQPEDTADTLRVLADGTQDLTALIGLFATDSVELCATDFPSGSLYVAMSSLSLLGLLGHIRALLKLALGPRGCENAAFSAAPLRPLYGVLDSDRLPADEITNVYYLHWREVGRDIEWSLAKTAKHTKDTMPWIKSLYPASWGANTFRPNEPIHHFYTKKGHTGGWYNKHPHVLHFGVYFFTQAIAMAITTGILAPFTYGLTWTRLIATLGLFLSMTVPSSMWCWSYLQESVENPSLWVSHSRSDFAAFRIDRRWQYGWFQSKVLLGWQGHLYRAVTVVAAIVATVGYVCQYIELRKITPTKAGIWLAIQGALALVRLVFWVIYPHVAEGSLAKVPILEPLLRFGKTVQSQALENNDGLTELELVISWVLALRLHELPRLTIPFWARNHLHLRYMSDMAYVNEFGKQASPFDFKKAFHLSYLARRGVRTMEIEECLRSEKFWDLPGHTFMNWLYFKLKQKPKTELFGRYGCRIIEASGTLHFWPWLETIYFDGVPTARIFDVSSNDLDDWLVVARIGTGFQKGPGEPKIRRYGDVYMPFLRRTKLGNAVSNLDVAAKFLELEKVIGIDNKPLGPVVGGDQPVHSGESAVLDGDGTPGHWPVPNNDVIEKA